MSVETIGLSEMEKALGIKQTGELEFEGLTPLTKPSLNSRGVYGGNLCGQAILVAMQTVDNDFVPHSLHSYFVAAGNDQLVCQYKVEKVSTGKNFANRLVRLYQNNDLKYVVMVSLTKRNSIQKTKEAYEKTGKGPRPFEFQKPHALSFGKHNVDELPFYQNSFNSSTPLQYKLLPEFIEPNSNEELQQSPSERNLGFYIKANDKPLATPYRYATMGLITDSLFLTSLSRVLHLPKVDKSQPLGSSGGTNAYFFSVSLDHSIYFHDDNFDPTSWLYFEYLVPRFSNNRAMFNGYYYNAKGQLVASMVQEGLVFFKNDSDLKAKL